MFWKRGTSGQCISNLSVQSRVRWGCRGAEILHFLWGTPEACQCSEPAQGRGQPTGGDEPSPGSKEPEAQAVDPSQGTKALMSQKVGAQGVPGHRKRCCKLSPPFLPPQSLSFSSKQETYGAILVSCIDRMASIAPDVSGLVADRELLPANTFSTSWQVPLSGMPPLVWHYFGDKGAHLQSVPLQKEA